MSLQTDGYQTLITFTSSLLTSAGEITLLMHEEEVTPPGVEGGDAIKVTSMRNSAWHTFVPQSLKTLTDGGALVSYDPELYEEMIAMINDNQAITITFPGTETLVFWGFVKSFIPGSQVIGSKPTANIVIVPTNRNGGNSDVEIAPVYSD